MSPIPLKHFYMIRHGETEANAAQIMAGSIDSPLTERGRQQALEAQKVVKKLTKKPAAIFHSHLSRARDTALIINKSLNVKLYEDPDLAEIHAGEMEGVPYAECHALFNDWPSIKGGEDQNDFFERVRRGKSRAIEQFNDPILIVCHGGVMRAFGEIHGVPTPGRFQNAHLYEFVPNPQKQNLPWNIFDYKLCSETQNLIRTESNIYDLDSASKIAS
ncbi:MAG: histidine phosphatase family protein [Alphaproteobacteria bacterium]|nr:histidine phosphatase family protein [Alphaproteobacteria bacterium]